MFIFSSKKSIVLKTLKKDKTTKVVMAKGKKGTTFADVPVDNKGFAGAKNIRVLTEPADITAEIKKFEK